MINGRQLGRTPTSFLGSENLAYMASYFNLLLGILVPDRRIHVSAPPPADHRRLRAEAILAKFWLIVLGIWDYFLLPHRVCGLFAYLRCQFAGGGAGDVLPGFHLVQAIGYMSLALLIGHLVRKVDWLFWGWYTRGCWSPSCTPACPIAWTSFFPMKVLAAWTPFPREMLEMLTGPTDLLPPEQAVFPAFAYSLLFCLPAYVLLRVRDL